jgi:glutamate-5-semialdehyde dehydrogenase
VLALASTDLKNRALTAIATAIRSREKEILAANAQDVANASPRIEVDRLRLTAERIAGMARDVEAVAGLADPVGETFDEVVRPNGLTISKRRVPLGVVGVVYESRPNVTSDVAAICIKTGNAVVLRGGSEALASNRSIVAAIQDGLKDAGLPETSVQLITSTDRALVQRMLKLREFIDVIIPRGGEGLIKATIENATIPVIETGAGVCHTYVDRSADQDMALRIVYNAKVRRPTICNALDTLLVHRDLAPAWLPKMAAEWGKARVEIRADGESSRYLGSAGGPIRAGRSRGLGQRVSVACRRGQGGRQPGRSARPHPRIRVGALGGDRHGRRCCGRPVPERSRRGGGLRERQHAVHRRWRVRPGSRSRHFDAEAARERSDGTARADNVQVDRRGNGTNPNIALEDW